ncbi:hypothetical protein [Kitasatospora sp. NPDC088134]|uniref:hypothetical protein n=1 Tax=Kitasatospora sp. NPDC088134 TaxID=3364071 RepID=UPI0038014B6A
MNRRLHRLRLRLALAERVVIGRGRRRAMLLSLFAVPVLLAALTAGCLQWTTATAEQRATDRMGSAAAVLEPAHGPSTGGTAPDVLGRAAPGATATELVGALQYPLLVDGTTVQVGYWESDWERGPARAGFRLLDGRFPTGPGEVAVTAAFADAHRLGVGGTVVGRWSDRPARIVGLVEQPQAHDARTVLGGPGQAAAWYDRVHALEYGTSSSWLLDLPAGTDTARLAERVRAAGWILTTRDGIRASRSMIEREPGVVTAPGVLLVAVGAAAAFGIRMRRLQREFTLLSAVGLDGRWVLGVCRLAGVTASLRGTVTGYLLGVLLSLAARPLLRAVTAKDLAPVAADPTGAVLLLVLSVGCATLAIWFPTRLAQRRPVARRRSADRPARHGAARRAAAVSAGLGAAALAGALLLGGSRDQSALLATAGSLALFAVLIGSVPACLRLLARAAAPAPAMLRIALRNLAREPRRPTAAVAIGIFAVASSTAVLAIVASGAQEQRRHYTGNRHLGQVEALLRHEDGPDRVAAGLRAAFGPGTPVAVVKEAVAAPPAGDTVPAGGTVPAVGTVPVNGAPNRLGTPSWSVLSVGGREVVGPGSGTGHDRGLVGVVDTPEEFAAVTGRAPGAEEWRTLGSGGLLAMHPGYLDGGRAVLLEPSAPAAPAASPGPGADPGADPGSAAGSAPPPAEPRRTVPGVLAAEVEATTLNRVGALVTTPTARAWGADVLTVSVMASPGEALPADGEQRVARALEPLGVPVTDVRIERGPLTAFPVKWLLVLGLGSLAAAVSTVLALSASAQELRPDLRRLFEMGFPPGARRAVVSWQSVAIALLAVLGGTAAGLVLGCARLLPYRIALAVPWGSLGLWVLGPILLGALAGPLLAPSGRRLRRAD